MKVGEIIKTPPSSFIKEITRYKGDKIHSFFYNVSRKKEGSDEYEIAERYVVFVENMFIKPDTEIVIDKIIETKPKENISADGRKFLNNLVWVEISLKDKAKPKEPEYTVKNDTEDMPLPF